MPAVLTLALICDDVYQDSGTHVVGYQRIPSLDWGSNSSFFGAAYFNGSVGVIAFRGTNPFEAGDLDADKDIALGKFPIDQLGDSFNYCSMVKKELINRSCSRFVVTGHSLGGGLTQLVAARITTWSVTGVTFNAPGMASLSGIIKIPRDNFMNVYNYRARDDMVSGNSGPPIGRAQVPIDNGGKHSMTALIAGIRENSVAGIKH